MLAPAILALLLAAGRHPPPADDAEAYRLDALQTQALNRRALSAIRKPAVTTAVAAVPAPVAPIASRDDMVRHQMAEAMQRWRDRVAACRAGDERSCDR